MTELFLEYRDENGELKRRRVDGEKCVVGRHSESNICIPDGRLSRQHLKMDRFGDVVVVSDAGSSNGTFLNGQPLKDPVALKKGDVLDLGGLKIDVVFESEEPEAEQPPMQYAETSDTSPPAGSGISVASQPAASGGSGAMLLWIAIPVFGLIFLFFAGAIVFLVFSGPTTTVAKKQSDSTYTDDDFDTDTKNTKSANKNENKNSGSTSTTGTGSSNATSSGSDTPSSNSVPTANLGETAKVEQHGGAFLRRIADKDPRAFITTEHAAKLSSKIKQFNGSSAVAENLKSANKDASRLKSLAEKSGVRPQFLAIAAVAKLGSSRGDVYQTADSMAPVLGKLSKILASEFGYDAVLVVAAYSQGTAGEFLKMRNMLQEVAKTSSESTRTVRTIWFLQANGKITPAEYDAALTFLAIGTISQNPKDFGVNAEALTL